MRIELFTVIASVLAAVFNNYLENRSHNTQEHPRCQCEARCRSDDEVRETPKPEPGTGTVPHLSPHKQPYWDSDALAPAYPSLSADAPAWLASWAHTADRQHDRSDSRGACASLRSLANRTHAPEPLAGGDRRALQARAESLRRLCPYFDEGGP